MGIRIELRKMQLKEKVKLENFDTFLKEQTESSKSRPVSLTRRGLHGLICLYATSELLKEKNNTISNTERIIELAKESNKIAHFVNSYVWNLLGLLPDYTMKELKRFETYPFIGKTILNDKELLGFVREYICDEINLFRNFEFGEIIIKLLMEEIFSEVPKFKLAQFQAEVKSLKKSFDEEIYDRILKETRNLKNFEMMTLLAVYNYQFNRDEMTLVYTYDYGQRFKEKGLSLNLKLSQLKEIVKKTMNNNLGLKKRRGRRI